MSDIRQRTKTRPSTTRLLDITAESAVEPTAEDESEETSITRTDELLAIIRRMERHFKSKSCLDSAENKLTLRVHLDQMITTLIRIDLQFGVIFERVRDNESLCSTTNKLDGLIEKMDSPTHKQTYYAGVLHECCVVKGAQ